MAGIADTEALSPWWEDEEEFIRVLAGPHETELLGAFLELVVIHRRRSLAPIVLMPKASILH